MTVRDGRPDESRLSSIGQGGAPVDDPIREPGLSIPCYSLDLMPKGATQLFGRTSELKLIDDAFFPNILPDTQSKLDAETLKKYCITGAGGVGKSRLAVEFVSTRKGHFDVICWLSAASRTKLLDGYKDFAAKLGLISSARGSEDTIAMNYVNTWRSRPVRNRNQTQGPFVRWLLAIDNVNKPDDLLLVDDFPHQGRGCVLVIGRDPSNRTNSRFGPKGHEVEPLAPSEAVDMLL